MHKYLKISIFGVLVWLIPFVCAFFFYGPDGTLQTDIFLFKSVMIVVGMLVAGFLLVKYFKSVRPKDAIREGVIVGFSWLVINLALDFLILLPMSGMSMADYIVQIGMRYVGMPIFSVSVGIVKAQK